jgi:glycine/D-amino acid oxidase-like deaminating enzyme/nitrite reductase/ring-hydroxylating ferredoxin subunit
MPFAPFFVVIQCFLRKDFAMTTPALESAKSEPVWTATSRMPRFSPLKENIQVDVCIVGAGIAGLTTAYLLTQAGKKVAVLDDGPIASGMTAATTAHLTNAIDDRYYELERLHGERGARLAAESHSAAIDRIEQNVKDEKIRCGFERLNGYLILAPGEDLELLDREWEAARRAGLDVVKEDRAPWASFDSGPCLRFPKQGQFHPLKYLAGLAKAIDRDGGKLFTKTHADKIEGGSPARIKAGKHEVTADAVVVATNVPVNDLLAIHTKQAPYMTYVIGARVPPGAVEKALYWDTGAVSRESRPVAYHYLRLETISSRSKQNGSGKHDLLIIGGEDHKSGQADDASERHARLEAWARERFPMIEEIEFVWGGQVMETIDGLAFIGRNPGDAENVFVATGDSGMGMTHGTIAGMLLTDLIVGRENPWATLYDPSRKSLRAAGTFAKENLNVAAQYAAWLTGGEVASVDEIAAGSGAIVRRGLTKCAVYRDDKGNLHERSAVCPHLGCIVQWNPAESSWDCPCHGSRFNSEGQPINGPANSELAEVEGK